MVVQNEGKKEDFELPESQKYKLTLGIDREIVRRAKIANINISYWTEQFLKALTFKDVELETSVEEVTKTYYGFFEQIGKIVKEYNLEILVGGRETEKGKFELTLRPFTEEPLFKPVKIIKNLKTGEEKEIPVSREVKPVEFVYYNYKQKEPPVLGHEPINEYFHIDTIETYLLDFYKPTEILENLFSALLESAKTNKEKIHEIKIAMRILKSIFHNGNNQNNKNDNSTKR